MNSFEGLRPIITPHFYLDWLTHFRLNDVLHFQQQWDSSTNIATTSQFINNTMRQIMRQKDLIWGVMNKEHQFIGLAGITHLNSSLTIYVQLMPTTSSEEIKEIISRMILLQQTYWPDIKPAFQIISDNKAIKTWLSHRD